MDIQPQTTQQPVSDDQELAKALAGISQEQEQVAAAPVAPLQFEETPVAASAAPSLGTTLPQPSTAPAVAPLTTVPAPLASGDLEGIKKTALNELRPLIDKVDLPAEEKFDTYLMLIRSTDDQSLIAPAHAAAQAITDEKRKAQALLDVIKEIDFLSHPTTPAA